MKTDQICETCKYWKNNRCWNGHADEYTDITDWCYGCGEFWEAQEEVAENG